MNTIPILLAIAGFGLLVWEVWAFIFIRRLLKTGRLSQKWRRWRIVAFVVGGVLGLTTLWQGYPIGGGNAAGIPFSAAWFDAQGRDYVGALTLPAILGNLAVWFLLPQVVLAYISRRHLSLYEHTA